MLDFVEFGEYPPYWSEEPKSDIDAWKNIVDLCKTAVIKTIVEVAGDEKNLEVLWDPTNPTGFVARMIRWLHSTKDTEPSAIRDDLVICSSLSLGNLARKGEISDYLVSKLSPDFLQRAIHSLL